jgi:hypothetical protein
MRHENAPANLSHNATVDGGNRSIQIIRSIAGLVTQI